MDWISTGNAREAGLRDRRSGWFIGHFIDDDALRRTPDVEVKWGVHTTNESNGQFSSNQTAKTMSVLIQGRFRLSFRHGEKAREVLLEKPGDYVLWDAGVQHNWLALEQSIVLTVRWPSLPQGPCSTRRSRAA